MNLASILEKKFKKAPSSTIEKSKALINEAFRLLNVANEYINETNAVHRILKGGEYLDKAYQMLSQANDLLSPYVNQDPVAAYHYVNLSKVFEAYNMLRNELRTVFNKVLSSAPPEVRQQFINNMAGGLPNANIQYGNNQNLERLANMLRNRLMEANRHPMGQSEQER